MELLKVGETFIAKTAYGEWEAKQAGFTWDPASKVWKTSDQTKAHALAIKVGQHYHMPETPSLTPAQPPVDLWPAVPEGKFAITDPAERILKFYQVDKPKEGRWAGWTFLKVLASDTPWPIKDHQTKKGILDQIALDPLGAMARYGQSIGSCGYCGKTLTDATSRQIGIGPVCRKSLGLK